MNLEERKQGLGGSDIGAILGLNPWRTPFQVWQDKTGDAEPFDGNLQTRFGTYAEEFVAQEYCEQTGHRVQRFNAMLRHPEAPILGHVDRLVIPEGAKRASHRKEVRTDLGLEAKTASAFATGRGTDWGDAGTDQVPESYLVQCATYMALTGCPRWDLAVMFGNQEFRVYHLARDLELEDMILDEATRFWNDYVLAGIPPAPSTEAEARQRWPRHEEHKVIVADEAIYTMLKHLADCKARGKALEQEEQALKDLILPLIQDAQCVQKGGLALATYRANKDSQRIDWQAIAADLMELMAMDEGRCRQLTKQFTKTIPGARVLRLGKDLEALV